MWASNRKCPRATCSCGRRSPSTPGHAAAGHRVAARVLQRRLAAPHHAIAPQARQGEQAARYRLHVETLSLRRAKETDQLELRPGKRLALPTRQAYYDTIVNRNLFGPPTPRRRSRSAAARRLSRPCRRADGQRRRPRPARQGVFQARAVARRERQARRRERCLTWTPKETGQVRIRRRRHRRRLADKTSNREKIVLNVTEQPPAQKPKLDFDHANFTVLTAVLDLNGKGEVWLHVRPLGQTSSCTRATSSRSAPSRASGRRSASTTFRFISDGKLRKLAKGKFLEQAQVIADALPRKRRNLDPQRKLRRIASRRALAGLPLQRPLLTAEDKKAG